MLPPFPSPKLVIAILLLLGSCAPSSRPPSIIIPEVPAAPQAAPKAPESDAGDPFLKQAVVNAAARHCDPWNRWHEGQPYQSCTSSSQPTRAFGREARLELFRDAGGRIVGHALQFPACTSGRDALIAAVRDELELGSGTDLPYTVELDGTAIRLAYDGGDDTCLLTVAEGEFGKAYQAELLGSGMSGLFRISH